MTHGDQAKAKTAKSSQASATPKSSSKTPGQNSQAGKSGKGDAKAGEASKGGKISVKTGIKTTQAGPEKGSVAAAKEAGAAGKGSKARPAPPEADDTPSFTNAAVAAAFKRALKKYPNAFRRLTD